MKNFAIVVISLIATGSLVAAPENLNKEQVKEIAVLIMEKREKNTDAISEPQYNAKTGIWSCHTLTGVVHGVVFIEIRDKDRFFRILNNSSNPAHEFELPTSLKKRIARIAPLASDD